MITPLPLGKAEPKVRVSSGPSSDILNFYHTRYSSDYGASNEGFQPRRGYHKGTGYASNIRPVLSYSSTLDKEDNPFMAQVFSSMYKTTTKSDYVKYGAPGTETFPSKLINGSSGFVRDVKSHGVPESDVHKLWHSRLGCFDCPQPHRPLLHRIHAKSVIPQCYEDTEYKTHYTGEQLPSDLTALNNKTIGCVEPTGHVKNKNIEPITFKPSGTFLHPQANSRSYSMYQTSYQPFIAGTGLEALPNLDYRADRNTGNTRENVDTHPPFIPTHPKDFHVPQHKKHGDSTESRSVRFKEGEFKEEGGAVLNRTTHISLDPALAPRDPWRTHYASVHTDPTLKGIDREGHCRGGVQKPLDDGFTRSTGWTKFNSAEEPTATVRRIHPTVARSIMAENPQFGYPLYQKPGEAQAC